MNKQQFEALNEKEQLDFIKTQNPTIKRTKSVKSDDKERFGSHFYTYRLDNGWGYLKASTREELEAKFNAK